MTDEVSNALSILSYFSSLLDPISTSSVNQRQCCEKFLSKPQEDIDIGSSNLPLSSTSNLSTGTSTVALSLSNFSTCSVSENFPPVVIGLKLPLTLSCSSEYSSSKNSSSNLLSSTTAGIDHQTLFVISPIISPSISSRDKVDPMGPSVSQSLNDNSNNHQDIFTESSWSLGNNHCSPDSPLSCQKQSIDCIKSEHFFGRKNSDKNMSSEPPWRERGESTLQMSDSTLSFSIPYSTINENKFTENQHNITGFDLQEKSSNIPSSNSKLSGSSVLSLSNLQNMGNAVGIIGREEKVCAVCGDRALGCNFDAVSCESCKAFFRRNAFKEEKIKCLFTGNCLINVNTRRFCSHCRLRRCFDVGMKKDLILGIEEKKRRMEVVKQNRKRRSEEFVSSTTATTASPTTTSSSNQHSTPSEVSHNESTNLLTLAKLDPLMSTSSTSSLLSQTVDSQLVRKLTAEESHMLIDLNQVYDLSFTVDLEPLIHITQLNPSLNQLINQSSYTVLRLIKFAKRLEDFVKLSQDLQISILKGCWFHLLLLRPVSLFDAERDGWITPTGVIPTDILKNATGYVELHDDHVRYCRSIKSIIGNDIMLLVILLVLVLFAPDGLHVVAREVISNIQDRYVILLKHYLEAKYTFKRSAHMFPQLLEKIRELNSLVENHAKILMDINPQEIEPIMLEMLDFKN